MPENTLSDDQFDRVASATRWAEEQRRKGMGEPVPSAGVPLRYSVRITGPGQPLDPTGSGGGGSGSGSGGQDLVYPAVFVTRNPDATDVTLRWKDGESCFAEEYNGGILTIGRRYGADVVGHQYKGKALVEVQAVADPSPDSFGPEGFTWGIILQDQLASIDDCVDQTGLELKNADGDVIGHMKPGYGWTAACWDPVQGKMVAKAAATPGTPCLRPLYEVNGNRIPTMTNGSETVVKVYNSPLCVGGGGATSVPLHYVTDWQLGLMDSPCPGDFGFIGSATAANCLFTCTAVKDGYWAVAIGGHWFPLMVINTGGEDITGVP